MWLTLIKLAWRNLFRNKRRTIIASIAIGIGLAALIFMDALWLGMEENMVKTATASFLGDGQIHRKDFRDTQAVEMTINQLDEVADGLSQEGIVEQFTPRTLAFGMITSPANVSAISLVGVQPPTERFLSQIDDAITEGTYFEGDNSRDIVIGVKLAELLEVTLGNRVVVTVAQSETGDLSQEMFRISGIYHLSSDAMSGGMAFVRLGKAQEMLAIGSGVHEIAVKFTDTKYGRDTDLPFWEHYSQHDNEALGWTEILPQLQAMFEMSEYSKYIMGVILLVLLYSGLSTRFSCRCMSGCLSLVFCVPLAPDLLGWHD